MPFKKQEEYKWFNKTTWTVENDFTKEFVDMANSIIEQMCKLRGKKRIVKKEKLFLLILNMATQIYYKSKESPVQKYYDKLEDKYEKLQQIHEDAEDLIGLKKKWKASVQNCKKKDEIIKKLRAEIEEIRTTFCYGSGNK